MIEKGYVQETYLSDSYDMAQTALAEGEAGMYVNDTGVIDEIASKYPDLVENIGAFPLPLYDEAANYTDSSLPGALGITTACQGRGGGKAGHRLHQLFRSAADLC